MARARSATALARKTTLPGAGTTSVSDDAALVALMASNDSTVTVDLIGRTECGMILALRHTGRVRARGRASALIPLNHEPVRFRGGCAGRTVGAVQIHCRCPGDVGTELDRVCVVLILPLFFFLSFFFSSVMRAFVQTRPLPRAQGDSVFH